MRVPHPIPYDLEPKLEVCSECNCPWDSVHGWANSVSEACDRTACPCHSEEWQTVLYEGAAA